ncbi:MAG TPA: ribonuclease III [Nitrospira sp.]|nr:ribonuclease III [Nitrospira sp.]
MTPASSADSSPVISNYRFTNPSFLTEALTHKSYVNERRDSGRKHNERLEFLGDAVLSLIMSDYLVRRYPELSEGALSKLKAKLVSESPLANAARRLDLGARLKLGRGEELSNGRDKASLLADAFEAIIAAVYLDGGLEASRNFTIEALTDELRQIDVLQEKPGGDDYKTRFQEWCQKRYELLPRYVIVRETGPDHQKLFEVEVQVNDRVFGIGRGYSKKEAEQEAAQRALEQSER